MARDKTALHSFQNMTWSPQVAPASCKATHDTQLLHTGTQHYMIGSAERTCSTLSSLPMVSKQKTLPSSPRQYR